MKTTVGLLPRLDIKIPPRQSQRPIKSERRRYRLSAVERKLAAAVFFQAVNDLQKFRYERRWTRRALYTDARKWIASNDRSWPYSFLNVCDALHLTADLVRARLLDGTSHRVSLTNSLSTSRPRSAGFGQPRLVGIARTNIKLRRDQY